MQLAVSEIIIKDRIRRNLGDLSGLMESISRHGLMNPIVVNSKKELIAGHRRLESVRRLGWETVQVRVITNLDQAAKIEMEIDENLHRKSLAPEELADAYVKLDRLRRPSFFLRIKQWLTNIFHRIFKSQN
jgi:ParB family chromosome partitioning protein